MCVEGCFVSRSYNLGFWLNYKNGKSFQPTLHLLPQNSLLRQPFRSKPEVPPELFPENSKTRKRAKSSRPTQVSKTSFAKMTKRASKNRYFSCVFPSFLQRLSKPQKQSKSQQNANPHGLRLPNNWPQQVPKKRHKKTQHTKQLNFCPHGIPTHQTQKPKFHQISRAKCERCKNTKQ